MGNLTSYHKSTSAWPSRHSIAMANTLTSLSTCRLFSPRLSSITTCPFSSAPRRLKHSNPFQTGPAPPRLPKEEQEIFEHLQCQSTGAFSTPRAPPKVNQPGETAGSPSRQERGSSQINEGEELHPDVRRGAKPEFEGDVNPKTGEVGGPKNEPLRWGAGGDWSYNGRVTDF